jgi:CBS domain-containing protein
MAETTSRAFVPQLSLQAETARDLMSDNLISLRKDAGVQDAITLMVDRGYTAAPVIDESGRPLGVITISDILVHNREFVRYLKADSAIARGSNRSADRSAAAAGSEVVDPATVGEIMTPAIFTVMEDASAKVVVETLTSLNVHHLFVSDQQGILIGVISMGDILRKLK